MTALSLWTIYDHPTDYPDLFVARRFEFDAATPDIVVAPDLESLRKIFVRKGLVCIARDPRDDPKIVETWV